MNKLIFALSILISMGIYSQNITKLETVQSLYLETYINDKKLSSATGFIIQPKTKHYLVTNYHVVTNKRPDNGKWVDPKVPVAPNKIIIRFFSNDLQKFIDIEKPLLDKYGNPLWFQDSIGSQIVDVIELPFNDTANIKIFPVNYKTSAYDSVLITPTERVFILGFPLGLKSNHDLPIWKSGLIASEPDFEQEGKPIIWIDAITYPGMSGAPTYFMSNEVVKLKSGKSALVSGTSKFMGVFSHSHISNVYGALWKADYLKQIFDKLP